DPCFCGFSQPILAQLEPKPMRNPNDRNSPASRPGPAPRNTPSPPAGTRRPAPSQPERPARGDGGGKSFLEQLKQRLGQGPAGPSRSAPADPEPLDDLDGAESEVSDIVRRFAGQAASPVRSGNDEDDDYEPTMLLQRGDLASQVRESLQQAPEPQSEP